MQRIPGAFQLLLSLYIILTGDFPTLIQALAYGLHSSATSEFALAMTSGLVLDVLLLIPILALAGHPLGILHPLILALILWPLVTHVPTVIQDWGGWAGFLGQSPVETPRFDGLPGRAATMIWMAIAKYNGVQILALLSTYAGFWMLRVKSPLSRPRFRTPSPELVRTVMLTIVALSLLVLVVFIRYRGGVNEHLTSLGNGRFVELAGYGPILVLTSFGAIALYVWTAARPGDIKTPLFLGCLAVVTASQFLSSGTRSGALEVPLYVGLVWSLRRQRIPWKIALIIIPVMFVSIGLLGAVRSSIWYHSTADKALTSTTWAESITLAQQEVADRQALSASVPVVERGFAASGGPLLGKSYAAPLAAFFPRAIWKDKPRGVGSLYAQLFLGAAFSGTTIPVGPPAEMYWNFGIPGVVLLSILYGMLLRRVYNFNWRHYPSPFVTVFYVIFVTSFQFSSDRLVPLEQDAGLLLLCYLFVAMVFPMRSPSADLMTYRLAPQRAGPAMEKGK